jgi:universal stress protein A
MRDFGRFPYFQVKKKTGRRLKTRRRQGRRAGIGTRPAKKARPARFEPIASSGQLQRSADTAGPVIELVPMVLKVQRILVPIDFSQSSRKALDYAVGFARQFGAKIALLHVIEPSAYPEEFGYRLESESEWEKEATRRLRRLAKRDMESAFLSQVLVRGGPPFQVITSTADELNIDLIIIATRGYTGLKHVLIGSTAERVVRHAPCPVLVLRKREREFV